MVDDEDEFDFRPKKPSAKPLATGAGSAQTASASFQTVSLEEGERQAVAADPSALAASGWSSRWEFELSQSPTVLGWDSAVDPRKQKAINLYNKELNNNIIFLADDATLFAQTIRDHQAREEEETGTDLFFARGPSHVYGENFSSWPPNKPILVSAAEFGRTEIIRTLINEFRCDINVQRAEDSNTALHFAGYYGHDETVDALLQMGADCLSANKYHENPLEAVREGKKHWLDGVNRHEHRDPFFVCFRQTGREPQHARCEALLLAHI